ncbi:hypothetical protein OJ997_13480 [Solirubrobacter phytolaccae]|uniref:Uncharacterized protein n=1 Tax=Solirubrobacter phytolaccae TaxID=1404360 RepID=A0A9X3NAQ9_9ACTN|nr:hypothetical protein [Solirubrobacter phytolaccae]MDA0181312.1 hypothetical protein [Solirubrobacter phytolaccae]
MSYSIGLQIGRRFGSLPPIRRFATTQAALIALMLALLWCGEARAGTMYVYSCHGPSGLPVGTSGWAPMPGASRSEVSNDCVSGPHGTLFAQAVGAQPFAGAKHIWWAFTAARDTAISGFSVSACGKIDGTWVWINWDRPVPKLNTSPVRLPESLGINSDIGCHGQPPYWTESRNVVQRQGLATSQLFFVATCGLCDFDFLRGSIEVSSFRADIRDDAAPIVSAVRGPLVTNVSHAGVESVEFDASDAGVGVYRAIVEARILGQGKWIELAATPIGSSRASCIEADMTAHRYEFDDPQPCPLAVSGAKLDFDAGLLPPAEHELTVAVEDATGNRTSVITPRKFAVAAPAGSASPALAAPLARAITPRPVVLRIADGSRRALSSAEAFRVRGTLTEPDHRPLAGVSLTLRTRPFLPKPGVSTGSWATVGNVITGPDGKFDARIPRGESRTVQITRDEADGLIGVAAQVDVTVPAQLTAKAASTRIRNGRSAVLTGLVAGPIPSGGVLVALEVREPGRWIPVATTRRWVRTTAAGRFKLAYRFRRTFEPATYRFRVVAAEDSAFPYTRGVSRTITVRVRP